MKHNLLRKKNDTHTWSGKGDAVNGLVSVTEDIAYQFFAHGDSRLGSGAFDIQNEIGVYDLDLVNHSVRTTDPDVWAMDPGERWSK